MKRKYVTVGIVIALPVVAVFAVTNSHPLRVAYHRWRMNAEFNKLFGDPEPAGNGLASHDVTGIDVDAVLAKYAVHRQQLVDLHVLAYLKVDLPDLATDGSEQRLDARSAFVRRMWYRFPGHKHYHLAENGSFETWVAIGNASEWRGFTDSELERAKLLQETTDADSVIKSTQ